MPEAISFAKVKNRVTWDGSFQKLSTANGKQFHAPPYATLIRELEPNSGTADLSYSECASGHSLRTKWASAESSQYDRRQRDDTENTRQRNRPHQIYAIANAMVEVLQVGGHSWSSCTGTSCLAYSLSTIDSRGSASSLPCCSSNLAQLLSRACRRASTIPSVIFTPLVFLRVCKSVYN